MSRKNFNLESDASEGERAAERAKELFAEYTLLEEQGIAPSWGAFIAQHPEFADDLNRIRFGAMMLDDALGTRPANRGLNRALLVSGLSVVVAVILLVVRRDAGAPPQISDCLDAMRTQVDSQRMGALEELPALATVFAFAQAADPDEPAASEVTPPSMLADVSPDEIELDPELVLLADAYRDWIPNAAYRDTNEWAHAFLASVHTTAQLDVRVVDLDRDGQLASGVEIYVQKINPINGEIGPTKLLGPAPLVESLPLGDYRLTAFDRASQRYSEARVLSLPGTLLPPQVLFLRSTDRSTAKMARIDAGTFTYGAPDKRPGAAWLDAEDVSLPAFYLSPYEASFGEFTRFLDDLRAHGADWFGGSNQGKASSHVHPAVAKILDQRNAGDISINQHAAYGLTWTTAALFANWSGGRLPTDREWERAAKGLEGNRYPWGNEFVSSAVDPRPGRSRRVPSGLVHAYERGGTPTSPSILRLADNVQEWTEDIFVYPCPGQVRVPTYQMGTSTILRCRRGASHLGATALGPENTVTVDRSGALPDTLNFSTGVRLAKSTPEEVLRNIERRRL